VDANREEYTGELASLLAEDILQVDQQLTIGKPSGSARGEPHVLGDLALKLGQCRFEYGLDENSPSSRASMPGRYCLLRPGAAASPGGVFWRAS
jgi:hypothetical protein